MAAFLASIRRILTGFTTARSHGRSIDTNYSVFQEGDRVIFEEKYLRLSKPLQRNRKIPTRRGNIEHNDIIGKRTRDVVRDHKGIDYRITQPSLEEYVTLSSRLVTPVYPADANLIVSLLDIHTPSPSSRGHHGEPLEILEAGTGHGSLTLHLARAINAGNTCPPPIPQRSQCQILPTQQTKESNAKGDEATRHDVQQTEWDKWRGQRQAVLHTVEVNSKYSTHAESLVRGFRRGIYAGNVDFYVSSVEDWIQEQISRRPKPLFSNSPEPFLSYVILDMPSAQLRIPHVGPVLKTDGILAVFMPNVTQIGDCVNIIRQQNLPFVLDRAVELGTGISSGRLWDIRMATSRRNTKIPTEAKEATPDEVDEESTENSLHSSDKGTEESVPTPNSRDKGEAVMVCRPKVGEKIVGGGFVGIWRKMKR